MASLFQYYILNSFLDGTFKKQVGLSTQNLFVVFIGAANKQIPRDLSKVNPCMYFKLQSKMGGKS